MHRLSCRWTDVCYIAHACTLHELAKGPAAEAADSAWALTRVEQGSADAAGEGSRDLQTRSHTRTSEG